MSFTFQNPFAYFNNPNNSNPVGLGNLYIGLQDTDPVTPANQVPVFAVQPDGSELQIPQPVRMTAGGVLTYLGAPIQLKINAELVSVKVTSSAGSQLLYTARWGASISAAELGDSNSNTSVGGVTAGDLARKYEDCVFVEDHEATGNPLIDDSAAIQSAINTGKGVRGVNGKSYKASGLTSSTNGQFFAHLKLVKSSNNEIFESAARDLHFHYCSFDGDGLSSDNVHLTGDNPTFDHCSSANTLGRPLVSEGFGTRIIGTNDVYLTLTSGGAVPAIELGNSVAQTLYSQIVGITTSTSGGGVKLVKHGSCSISNSQISGIDVPFGSGAYIDTCRITGDLNINGNFTKVDDCTISGDVVIGDGVNPISAVKFGDGNSVQSGSTVTVNTKIIESVIHLDHLDDSVIIDDNLTGDLSDIDNSVYTKAVSFTPTWTGATTNPVLGNASLSAKYTRQGRTTKIDFSLTMGSTTTYGSGDWRFSLPVYAATNALGSVKILDAGNIFRIGVVEVDAANSYMRCFTDSAGGSIRDSVPFIWATDDKLDFSVIYESR